MAITDDLKDAINKNLPAEVGTALQARLRQADVDAENVKQVPKLQSQLQAEMNGRAAAEKDRDSLIAKLAAQEDKAEALALKELELSYKEKMVALREAMTATRVDDLSSIVRTVFCSPVSKSRVNESSYEPIIGSDGCHRGQKSSTKTTESESTGPNLQAPA